MQAQPRMDGEVLADRYVLRRLLKDSGDVATHAGRELATGRDVIVKLARLEAVPPDMLKRIEHEATVLRRLESEHIAALLELGREGQRVFLVQSYVDGITLQHRLEGGPLSLSDALSVARSIFTALRDAHEQEILHRDLKPSNIMVCPGSPIQHTTVIDFGLARSQWLDPSLTDLPAGTVRYMSPEQAGVLERSIDERSDLYSAGAVLFESLVGRPLFTGSTLGDVLREHVTLESADPRMFSPDIPRAVAELVIRLLAKDPEQRYGSAEAVLADIAEITASLDRGEAEPPVVVGLHDSRRTLAEPAFVGRELEMSMLLRELDRARSGQGGLVLLGAESGGGKTRLLDEFATVAAGRDAWVLCGQGVDQAAQRPFEVLTGVVGDVLTGSRRDQQTPHMLRERIGDRREAVCASFPELRRPLATMTTVSGPEAFGERRTVEALSTLLTALGTADRPAVVLLDDCQWADELTLKLLLHWQSDESSTAGRHTVVIAAFRSDEIGSEHPLRRAQPGTEMELPPLEAALIRSLAESMAGPLPPEATDIIVRLSEGSPFMASAVVRGLVETGALVEEPGGWRVNDVAMADVKASRQAATLLLRRLRLLPETTLDLLSVGAVLGKRFDPQAAADLAGRATSEARGAFEEAKRRHILWQSGEDLWFVHDKLRESVLGLLGDEQRRRLHILAAHRYEVQDPEACFELAYHFDAAGETERALPYALAAAHQARRQHAIDVAQQQYEIAERGAVSAPTPTLLEIVEGLGDVLTLRGRYCPAHTKFERARELASDRITQARIDGKLGDLAFKRRDLEAASAAIERGLRTLDRRVPKRSATFLLSCLFEIVVQVVHTLMPRVFTARRSPEGAEEEFVAMRLYSRLAHVYWFVRGSVPTFWAHQREMNLAERYPPSLELAQAYSEHAPAMSLIPYYRRGARYGRRSLEIRRELGDVWGQGQSLHFLGVLAYCTSRFEECVEHCRAAVRLLDRTGDRWEINTAEQNIALALFRLGDLEAAVDVSRRTYASGASIGDAQARGISLDAWSKASLGRVPADLVRAEIDDPSYDVQTNAEVLQAEAVRLLREHQPGEAVATLERARQMVKAAGLRQEYVAPIDAWLATALRRQIEALPLFDPDAARRLVRRGRRVARRARLVGRFFRNNAAHALRESGLLAAMDGRTHRARRHLEKSIAVADRLGMRHESAQSHLAFARVGAQHGWAGSEDVAEAREALRQIEAGPQAPATVTPSLIDRFDNVLEAGRNIASALTREAVYAATHAAGLTLLRGERCVVLETHSGPDDLVAVEGGANTDYSLTLARRAFAEGRPVLLDDDTLDASESVVLSGVRSALCAPIFVRGRVAAFFHIEHRKLAGLFGRDEERLAAYIATIAGVALENAEGFAEIQELTRTLEERVRERTKELDESNTRLDKSLTRLKDAYAREREITERLKRLDELKTDFIAMAAHDLRNPVTVISGFAEMLNDDWDSFGEDDRRDVIQRMTGSTRRLGEFIENLLQFARIESGELSYELAPFDLGSLVHKTVAEQSSGGSDRLRTSIELGLPLAYGDEQRNWQVLTNLLSNAMKFSRETEPIDVNVSASSGSLVVSVRDHGPGIDREDQERVFEKFGRVEGTQKRSGTGLGLYISRSIVEAQGGRLWVESEPGQGATFSYTIPIAPRS